MDALNASWKAKRPRLLSETSEYLPDTHNKVWGKKKCTRVCVYYKNYARFRQKSIKSAKSTHPENSKLVRQVHVVQKVPPGSMIEQKNGFFENTIFVKKIICRKKFTCICSFHAKFDSFSKKLFELEVSRHSEDSKFVRQVYIVLKMPPRGMGNNK